MSNTKHTPEPWTDGRTQDAIVSSAYQPPDGLAQSIVEFYGGYLIAESVASHNKSLIKAAPDLLTACKEARQWLGDAPPDGEGEFYDELRRVLSIIDAAIAKGEA